MAKVKGPQRNTKRRTARNVAGTIVSGVTNVFSRVVTSPLFIVAILLGWWMSTNEAKVKAFLDKLAKKPLFKPIGDYLLTKVKLLPGAVTVSLSSYTLARPRYALLLALVSLILVFEVFNAETPYWEHAVLAFFICAISVASNSKIRLVVVALAVITIVGELWGTTLFG